MVLLMKEALHPVQICAWRRMTPDEKWKLVSAANRMLRSAVRDRIRRTHRGWTPQRVEMATNHALLRART